MHGPTAPTLALRALRRHPDRIAFAEDGRALSYAGTLALIGRIQAVLAASGAMAPRVALLSANRAEAWAAEIAVQALGGSTTWLHPLAALPEQQFQIEDAQAQLLVVDAETYAERGGALAAGCPQLRQVWTLGPAGFGRDLLAAMAATGEHSPRDFSQAHTVASLGYTGGTTGRSKAALRHQHQAAAITRAILADFELPATPRYLAAAPISHVAGTKVLPTLLRGGTVHLQRGFDPDRLLATLQAERINMTLLVPTMVYKLLDHPGLDATDLGALELLLYGASPMSPTRLLEGMERIGPVFSQLYGQTECYPISLLRKADHDPCRPERFASCGIPLAGCDVRLLGDDGEEVALGEPGEICVRADSAMALYWNQPDLTAEALAGGWLHTSDIARQDDEGYLYIVDRKKDMVVSGGFNVYPREVEDVLTAHPAVAMAAVIGVPDATWGEAVAAMVVCRPGMQVDAQALMALVKQHKGAQQAPKRVDFVDALPLTALGKIDKKALRAPFWDGQQRKVG
jgi:fatty-acyl-CoA synthase